MSGSASLNSQAISFLDILDARETIRGIASRTLLVISPTLSNQTGKKIYLKLENFQPTKVFKITGAANKLRRLPSGSDIITASSGNHGFAISYVAKLLAQKATVCVPETANP